MNILYTNFHLDWGGGHTTYVATLARNTEHKLFVACPGSSKLYKKLDEAGFAGLLDMYFPRKLRELPLTFKTAARLRRFIEENDIDIVHTNGSQDNRLAFYASLFCRKKFKIVFTKHNSYRIKNIFSRWRFNSNDAVIFVSRSIYASIGFSNFKTPITVIENGIDTDYWQRREPVAAATGAKLRLVSNAGTSPHKGWMLLAEAIGGLEPAEKARLSVTVLGRIQKEDEIARAKTLCDINFPGFFEDTRPYLEQGDIGFVLSYGVETISFACREMMSMSLPVMVSNYASLPDNIAPGSGWVVNNKDVAHIRRTLRQILQMPPETLYDMKLAARKHAQQNFTLNKMIAATNAVYNSVMRKK